MDTTHKILIAGFAAVVISIGASSYYVVKKLGSTIYYAADDVPHQLIQYDQQKIREAEFEASKNRAIENLHQPFLIPPAPSRK